MNATERAREASAGLLDHLGISQRRAAELVGMDEKRLSERVRMGTLFLRDFLEIAHAENGADYLRMLADLIDQDDAADLPINAAMSATEASASTQGTIRRAREDGRYCHYEILEIKQAVSEQHATVTRLKQVIDKLEPGPVPSALAAE